jgi:hypothetical protein
MSDPTLVLLELVRQHTDDDTRRFESVDKKLDAIAADLKSLIEARVEARGAWRATVTIAGLVSGAVSGAAGFIAWILR